MAFFSRRGKLLFMIVLLLHCLSIYQGWDGWRTVTKLMLLPCLGLLLWSVIVPNQNKTYWLAMAGLFFSFLGDALLSQKGTNYFLAGMLAFMGTHICYILYFSRIQSIGRAKPKVVVMAGILLLVISLLLLFYLGPKLGDFRLPIILYMFLISSMAIMATQTITASGYFEVAKKYFIPGAFLFVVSDGILAINTFSLHNPMADIAVMASYGIAQYLLVLGFMNRRAGGGENPAIA